MTSLLKDMHLLLVKGIQLLTAVCLFIPSLALADTTVLHNGYLGDKVTYTILSDYTMSLAGTGSTYDFIYRESLVWGGGDEADPGSDVLAPIRRGAPAIDRHYTDERIAYMRHVTDVNIKTGITGIGHYTFSDCTELQQIRIASTVARIGQHAFDGCSALTSITVGRTPATLEDYAFQGVDKATCVLYVPFGCTELYRAAGYDFDHIVELGSDINAYANLIYVDSLSAAPGTQVTLSVQLKNHTAEVRGYQFDLNLPEGASFAKDSSNKLMVSFSEARASRSDMNFSSNILEDGSLRVLCYATDLATFSGEDGEICTITLNLADNMAEGDYALIFSNVVLTDVDAHRISIDDEITCCLNISDFILGDANNDKRVRIGDVTAILNYIQGNTPAVFNERAADANQDGRIRIGDATTILGIIRSNQ